MSDVVSRCGLIGPRNAATLLLVCFRGRRMAGFIFPNTQLLPFASQHALCARFPAHILSVPKNVLASNSYDCLVPQHRLDPRAIDLFDHGCPPPNNRNSVALFDRAFLSALGIPFAASAHEEVKSSGSEPRVLFPEADAGTIVNDKDVAAIRSQGQESGLNFREC